MSTLRYTLEAEMKRFRHQQVQLNHKLVGVGMNPHYPYHATWTPLNPIFKNLISLALEK